MVHPPDNLPVLQPQKSRPKPSPERGFSGIREVHADIFRQRDSFPDWESYLRYVKITTFALLQEAHRYGREEGIEARRHAEG